MPIKQLIDAAALRGAECIGDANAFAKIYSRDGDLVKCSDDAGAGPVRLKAFIFSWSNAEACAAAIVAGCSSPFRFDNGVSVLSKCDRHAWGLPGEELQRTAGVDRLPVVKLSIDVGKSRYWTGSVVTTV